jgi:integrase
MSDEMDDQTLVNGLVKPSPEEAKTSGVWRVHRLGDGREAVTIPPGIRQNASTRYWFLNKSINGRYCGERLEANGKPVTAKTIAITLAEKRITELRQKFQQSAPDQDLSKVTFAQAVEDYEKDLDLQVATKAQDPATKDSHQKYVNTLAKTWAEVPEIQSAGKAEFRRLNPKKVSLADCQAWLHFFCSQGYSPAYTNHVIGDFRRLFNIIIERYNPTVTNWAGQLKKSPLIEDDTRIPTEQEWERIMAELRKDRNGVNAKTRHCVDLIEALSWTGLRLEECCRITKSQVNLQEWTIFIPAKDRKGRKGKRRDLTTLIIPQARSLFQRLVENADPETGRIFHVQKAYKTLGNACKRAGFPRLTHHDLRKFFSTRCALSGLSPAVTAKLLGHRDGGYLAMTVYTKVSNEHLAQLKNTLYFGPPPAPTPPDPAGNVIPFPKRENEVAQGTTGSHGG